MVKENGNSYAVLGRTQFAEDRNYMARKSHFVRRSMKLLRKILLSSGGVKQELFQTDDVYEQYYFVPQDKEGAYLQIELLTDKERSHAFFHFF